jgi:hypothetical protein
MSKSKINAVYVPVLKAWQGKVLGPKPTADLFDLAHLLGCRPGKQALARAMEMRECGATNGQVVLACTLGWGSSGSHHNKRRELVHSKMIRVVSMPNDKSGHTVYHIELTSKANEKLKPEVTVEETTASV